MIKKTFVQILVYADDEGRYVEWIDTNRATFEEYAKNVKRGGFGPQAVREVEKTFNPETFTITVEEIRKVEGK